MLKEISIIAIAVILWLPARAHSDSGACRELYRAADETILSLVFFDQSVGLAGSWGGGLFRTADGGASWNRLEIAIGQEWVSGLAALASGQGIAVTSGGIVLVTSDKGETWTRKEFPGASFTAVALDKSMIGWAVGVGGTILKTADAGLNWEAMPSPTTNTLFDVSAPEPAVTFVVGEKGIILRSSDGGQTWQQLDSKTSVPLFSVCFPDANNGWAGGREGTLLSTADGGNSFTQQQLAPNLEIDALVFSNPKQGWAAGGDADGMAHLWKTVNGGAEWQRVATEIGRNWLHALWWSPGRLYLGGTRGFVAECPTD